MTSSGTVHEPKAVSSAFAAMLTRDLALAVRRRSEIVHPIIFFVVITTLFPLAVVPDPQLLAEIGAGIVWVGALLSTFMSLDTLFRSDFDDGALDQMLLSPTPLPILVSAKVLVHWLTAGLPLIIISPALGLLLAMPLQSIPALIWTLVLGTPVLSLVGAIGTALTVGLRRGGALLALLVLPFYIPVLIFGAQAVAAAGTGQPIDGQLYVLGAFLALAVSLAPLAIAGALRASAA